MEFENPSHLITQKNDSHEDHTEVTDVDGYANKLWQGGSL